MNQTSLRAVFALVLLASAGFAACDDDATGPRVPEDVTFDAALGVDLNAMTELDSGVYIQTLASGEGIPLVEGDRAVMDYTLWLPNGIQVDTGTDVTFEIGEGAVIDGFRLGVIGMAPGETRLLVIPSELGYGGQGNTGIPPHSVLVFRVTLNAFAGD
jgi:FKBP-type peptidyl-prolyl cis-trans isomerase